MYFFIHRFIVCLLIPSLWLFAAKGNEKPVSHHTPQSYSDEAILNYDFLASNNEGENCTVTQDGHLDCGESSISDQNVEKSNYLYKDQTLVEYFLDTIYTNAGCECQINDGCTRGCPLESNLDEDHPLPIRKCERKKSMRSSTKNCALHTTGAIMAVVNESLSDHCKNEDIIGYGQCVKNFAKDIKNNNINICQHGFRFPFAFCMLNLDGQSFHLYDSISTKSLKSICKNWDQYNQSLLAVNVPLYDGGIMIIPLFKKISPEKNKEFQRDPSKIPKGAIIITKLNLEYGHVEVKTDRNECGKNKTQTCFCSDFCTERTQYPSPVFAVFEWHPEFIRYVSRPFIKDQLLVFEWNSGM